MIYSTHSPFMIDWNYPQRVRLFQRDSQTRRTHINNAPWSGSALGVWDPLRDAIGVTVGDVAVVGEANILVEGISDQIILANAAAALMELGQIIIDTDTTIIPYSDEPALLSLLSRIRSLNGKAVVLRDSDSQGKKVEARCRSRGVVSMPILDLADSDASAEDTFGIAEYTDFVNRVYADFDWFRPIDAARVETGRDRKSLGRFFTDYFEDEFDRSFSKVAVAIFIAEFMRNNPDRVPRELVVLLRALAESLRQPRG